MAEGVQTAGSVAESSGMDFDLFAASVAKTAEVTRLEGSQIGNAMKTIMARTSRVKVPGEDVSSQVRSKTAAALHNVGVDVYNAKGEYQDFSVTLDQLAEKWDTLSDATKANVGENMAGVRNLNILNALIENWQEIRDLAQQTSDDPDFYLQVQEKSMESLQSKTDTLKASMQDFWNSFLDPEFLGSGIELITHLTNSINNLLKIVTKVPLIGKSLAPKAFLGLTAGSAVLVDNIAKAKQEMKNNKEAPGVFGGVKKGFIDTVQGAKTLFLKNKENGNSVFKTFKKSFADFSEVKSLSTFGTGVSNFWAELTNPGKFILGASAVVTTLKLVKAGIEKVGDSTIETSEKASEAEAKISSNNKTLKEGKETINKYGSEWSRLSKGVNLKNGENVSLSTEEFERYHDLTNKIAELLPNTVTGFDNEGNAILNLTGSLKSLNEEYEKLIFNKSVENSLNGNSLIENFKNKTGNESGWTIANNTLHGEHGSFVKEVRDFQNKLKDKEHLPKFKGQKVETFIRSVYGDNGTGGVISGRVLSDLERGGIDVDKKMNEDVYREITSTIDNLMSNYNLAIQSSTNEIKDLMQNSITKNLRNPEGTPFKNISLGLEQSMRSFVTELSPNIIEDLIVGQEISPNAFIDNILYKLNEAEPEVRRKFIELFNIDANDNFLNTKKKISLFDDIADYIPHVDKNELEKSLGIDEQKKMRDTYNDIRAEFFKESSVPYKDKQKFFRSGIDEGIKKDEALINNLELIDQIITDKNINTVEGLYTLKKAIKDVQSTNNEWNLEALSREFNIQAANAEYFAEKLEALSENTTKVEDDFGSMYSYLEHAFTSHGLYSADVKGLKEVFGELEGFDADNLFQSTYTGIQLNKTYLNELKGQYKTENLKKYDDELEGLNQTYRDLCNKINDVTAANDGLNNSMELSSLIEKRNATADAIEMAKEKKAAFMGVINELAEYQMTKSNKISHEGMMYQELYADYENDKKDDSIKNLYKNQWFGDEKFQAWTQLWSNQDLSNMGSYEIKAVYEAQAGLMDRWLKDGQEGLANFVQDVNAEYAGFVGADNRLDTSVLPSIAELADKLKVSEPLIEEMFRALNRSGEDLNFEDLNDALDNYKYKAEKALEGLDEEHKLDIDLSQLDDIEKVDDAIEKVQKALSKDTNPEIQKTLKTIIDYLYLLRGEKIELEFDFHSEEGIKKLDKLVDDVNEHTKVEIEVDWKESNPKYFKDKRKELQNDLDESSITKNKKGKIKLDTEEGANAYELQKALFEREWELDEEHNLILNLDISDFDNKQQEVLLKIQEIQQLASEIEFAKSQSDNFDNQKQIDQMQTQYNALIENLETKHPKIVAYLELDNTSKTTQLSIDTVLEKIKLAEEEEAKPKVSVDNSEALKSVDEIKVAMAGLKDKNLKITTTHTDIYVKQDADDSSKNGGIISPKDVQAHAAHGNAHVFGNAFAKGSWGAKKSSTSLVGELGRELVN